MASWLCRKKKGAQAAGHFCSRLGILLGDAAVAESEAELARLPCLSGAGTSGRAGLSPVAAAAREAP